MNSVIDDFGNGGGNSVDGVIMTVIFTDESAIDD